MSDFDLQVKQVVMRLLKDDGFEIRTDGDQEHSMVVNSVGRVCVLPPYIALYDFRQGQVGQVELSDPDSLEQFLVIMRKHRDLVKLGINRSRQAMTVYPFPLTLVLNIKRRIPVNTTGLLKEG